MERSSSGWTTKLGQPMSEGAIEVHHPPSSAESVMTFFTVEPPALKTWMNVTAASSASRSSVATSALAPSGAAAGMRYGRPWARRVVAQSSVSHGGGGLHCVPAVVATAPRAKSKHRCWFRIGGSGSVL